MQLRHLDMISHLGILSTKYSDKKWADVPENVKEAAMFVGFTQELWYNDSWPEGLNKGWDDLTPAEQEAVMVLGYNKLVGMGVMITLSI
jgi:hypothetical protein